MSSEQDNRKRYRFSLFPLQVPIVTENFYDTFFVAFVGFMVTMAPIALLIFNLDVALAASSEKPPFGSEKMSLFLGNYSLGSLYLASKDLLIASVALGTAALINYREVVVSGPKPVAITRAIANSTLLFTITSLIFLIWIMTKDNASEIDPASFKKYIATIYAFCGLTIIGYFATLLQIRRQVDAERLKK